MAQVVKYVVHSAVVEDVPTEAKLYNGRVVMAKVPGLTVELIDGKTHSHTFKFVPDSDAEMTELRELYTVGATITTTHAAG
jgi:hypothetical protein